MKVVSVGSRPPLSLPPETVAAFDAHLAKEFPRATRDRVIEEVAALSDAFTAERAELPGSYLNQPPRRSAYLAYFHPQQVLRGLAAFEEVRTRATARELWPKGGSRVADLGAGLGAMSQALLLAGERPSEITLVDHQKSALADARALTLAVAGAYPPRIRTASERLGAWLARAADAGWRYDVVLLGGVLNEIREDWAPVLDAVAQILDPETPGGGIVVIVEPALPQVARRLMQLREDALDTTTTIAPCTHGDTCPLLALKKDWCFTVRAAEFPPRVVSMARELGHRLDQARFALWAFAARPNAAPFERDPARHARVVSDRMDGEHVLCIEGRRERVRHEGAMVRGDLVLSLP